MSPVSCGFEQGTYDVNVLVAGRGITGKAAFKPAPTRAQPKNVQA